MRMSDYLWFSTLAALLVGVGWIGTIMVVDTRKTTDAIENAYKIRDWAVSQGPRSQTPSAEDQTVGACAPPAGSLADCANWVDAHPPKADAVHQSCDVTLGDLQACFKQLVAQDGPLNGMVNPFDDQSPVFGSGCEAGLKGSLGSIAISIGYPKSSTDSTLEYRPLKKRVPLTSAVPIRLVVCGRLYRKSPPVDFLL
jgi:hypothetical protein